MRSYTPSSDWSSTSKTPGELFDNLIQSIRTFATNGEFDDDVCLVGMDYVGLPPFKS